MTTSSTLPRPSAGRLAPQAWAQIGAVAAIVSIAAVLVVQALALTLWPDLARFKPLDSYARSALFVLIPTVGATAVLAWLVGRRAQPVRDFIYLAAVVLLVSIIPDYALPFPDKTLLASTVTAALHVVAGISVVALLLSGYRRQSARTQ